VQEVMGMPICRMIEFLVFPDQSIKPILCAMLVVAVDSYTSLEELFPLSSFILRKVLTGTVFNDGRDMKF